MTAPTTQPRPSSQLQRLLGFLERDPTNLPLLAEAAGVALDEGDTGRAADLIDRYAALADLPPPMRNLRALVAMAEGRHADAAETFASLLEIESDDPALRFNLAWCRAMSEDFEAATQLIDETVAAAVPGAAALHVESLHHLGRLEEALARGMGYAERLPDDRALMGSLALVAFDADEADLARGYADQAGPANADARAVVGMLLLGEQHTAEALAAFDEALAIDPDHGRGLLGRGLALMAAGQGGEAAADLARSAERFEDHQGSWMAAGWAELARGDQAKAREYFERAVSIAEPLADGHASLAILDLVEGARDRARERIEEALRLDPNSVSAALARSMLLAADGDPEAAERVRQTALDTPIGPGGTTIAQAMAGLNLGPRPKAG